LPDHNSNIGKQIVELGRKVAGINARKAKKGLPEFFSFVERFRKNEESATNQHSG